MTLTHGLTKETRDHVRPCGAFAEPGETPEQSYARRIEHLIPQGVPQTEEDMAELALYLVRAPHVTGQAINLDGAAAL